MSKKLAALSYAPKTAGKGHLLRHLKGGRLTQRQAILAKCCDCMGYHADGREDCLMKSCSLYPWMPYKGKGLANGTTEKEEPIPEMPLRTPSMAKKAHSR